MLGNAENEGRAASLRLGLKLETPVRWLKL
jgi:hypothetical protein